ncbi:MAG: hypothetical protein H7Y13_01130 [Sphingobacteriaceae bacterium]|nr:hypothetical protein [Sphingobacteriaceae bacterium]
MSEINQKIEQLREKIERGELSKEDTLALQDLGVTYETSGQIGGDDSLQAAGGEMQALFCDLFNNKIQGFKDSFKNGCKPYDPPTIFKDIWKDKKPC